MIKGQNFAFKRVEDYMIDEQRINNKKLVKSKKNIIKILLKLSGQKSLNPF